MRFPRPLLLVAVLPLLACVDDDLCEGDAPYDRACVCDPFDGRVAREGFADLDGDGYGAGAAGYFCGGGHASNADDCDDGDAALYPADLDGDGATACDDPPDCDDADPATYPGVEESCDGRDNDCDGAIPDDEVDADGDGARICDDPPDCDDTDAAVSPIDADGDGASGCDDPPDCDDTDDTLYPADLDGDGVSPCDGDCDDGDASINLDDLDGDGFSPCDGDCDDTDPALDAADADNDGYSTCDDDCDDADDTLSPADLDGDGFSTCTGDCQDFNDTLTPEDLDGDGFSTCDGDCDDGEAAYFPGDVGVDSTGWVRPCAPLFAGDPGAVAWYGPRVERVTAIDDGARLSLLFGGGVDTPGIGLFYTDDGGFNWTLHGVDAVLAGSGAAGDWDADGVGAPAAIYDPADPTFPYRLFYAATDPADGRTHIGLALSADGVSWTRYEDPATPGTAARVLPAGDPGDRDALAATEPTVWLDGDRYTMVYRCDDGVAPALCAATSDDRGQSWSKWDPAPGAGDDPQPLVEPGPGGSWSADGLGWPLAMPQGDGLALLYGGVDDGGSWRAGVAHAPFGADGGVTALDALAPVFTAAAEAGRWDDHRVHVDAWWEDGGAVTAWYSGVRLDATVDGGELGALGALTSERPAVSLSEPVSDPHAMAADDEVTFAGSVSDDGPLDELMVVVAREPDGAVVATTYGDANGDFTVTAPPGTFDDAPVPYLVTVSAYDAGGLAGSTSIALDVSP